LEQLWELLKDLVGVERCETKIKKIKVSKKKGNKDDDYELNKEGCDLRDDKLSVLKFEDINNLEEDDKMDEEGRRKNNKKLNNWK
jgi:hypothetical protein